MQEIKRNSFLLCGLLLQVLVFWLHPDTALAIVSGIAGVFSVVLCAQGNILTFAFGFVQIVTYLIICWQARLYAEVAMNVFYFVSQLYGIWSWRKAPVDSAENEHELLVKTRRLSLHWAAFWCVIIAAVSVLTGWLLHRYSDDAAPYFDAFTTIPAILAQVLMVMRYRDQWYYWLFVDVLAVAMWLQVGNYSMAAMYAFWCANCVYGFCQWNKLIS